jgi:hypothetical protein
MAQNPTMDEAFALCFARMDVGASSVFVDPGGHAALKARYCKSFEERLRDPAAWQQDGPMVLRAAFLIGQVAEAIAAFHHSDTVTPDMAISAGAVAEKECNLRVGARGRWCTATDPLPGADDPRR